jgi:hypothetical protein
MHPQPCRDAMENKSRYTQKLKDDRADRGEFRKKSVWLDTGVAAAVDANS